MNIMNKIFSLLNLDFICSKLTASCYLDCLLNDCRFFFFPSLSLSHVDARALDMTFILQTNAYFIFDEKKFLCTVSIYFLFAASLSEMKNKSCKFFQMKTWFLFFSFLFFSQSRVYLICINWQLKIMSKTFINDIKLKWKVI